MVHHEQQFMGRMGLVAHRRHRGENVVPPVLGVDTDDDGDPRRRAGRRSRRAHRAFPVINAGRAARFLREPRSRRITFSTRSPSRTARRLLTPWMRLYS